jgi:hypothetical protein
MRVVLSAAPVKAERDLTLSGPAASAVIISVARSTAILASFALAVRTYRGIGLSAYRVTCRSAYDVTRCRVSGQESSFWP